MRWGAKTDWWTRHREGQAILTFSHPPTVVQLADTKKCQLPGEQRGNRRLRSLACALGHEPHRFHQTLIYQTYCVLKGSKVATGRLPPQIMTQASQLTVVGGPFAGGGGGEEGGKGKEMEDDGHWSLGALQ